MTLYVRKVTIGNLCGISDNSTFVLHSKLGIALIRQFSHITCSIVFCDILVLLLQYTPLNRVTSGPGYFD